MKDDPKPRAPVGDWDKKSLGLDTDAWERSYHAKSRSYGDPEESLAFYRRLFAESPISMIVTTPEFIIADANNAAQTLFGATLSRLRSRSFQQKVAHSDKNAFTAIAQQLFSGAETMSRPVLLRREDDSTFEVILTARMIRDEKGEPEFVFMVFLERGENVSSDML